MSLFGFLGMVSLWLYSWSQLTCSPSVRILHEHLIPQLSFTPAEARLPSCSISAFNPLHSWERLLWPGTEHSRFHQNLNFKRWLVFLGLPRKPSNLDEDLRQMSLSKRTLFCTGTEYKTQECEFWANNVSHVGWAAGKASHSFPCTAEPNGRWERWCLK